MNRAYLKRLIFRLFALMFAFGVVYSVQNPAFAVAPQQGWFISGTTTFSGKDSWVISYGSSSVSNPYYVELRTNIYGTPISKPFLAFPNFTPSAPGPYIYNIFASPITSFNGFSDYPWFFDRDWGLDIQISGISTTISSTYSDQFTVVLYDVTKYPTFQHQETSTDFVVDYSIPGILGINPNSMWPVPSFTRYNSFSWSAANPAFSYQQKFYHSTPNAYYLALKPVPPYTNSLSTVGSDIAFEPINIENLRIMIVPLFKPAFYSATSSYSSSTYVGQLYARAAFSFICPKDKAPSGLSIGDRWPSVRDFEVTGTLEDAYKDWIDNALAQTPVADPDDVTSQIEGYNQQLDAADNWGELETDAWNEVVPILDSFDFVFTILGIAAVVFVLLLFIKKGMA